MHVFRRPAVVLPLGVLLLSASPSPARGPKPGVPAAATAHFALHSDFVTNLNDALIEAGRARNDGKPELFLGGAEASCFSELPRSEQSAWNHAVDYYAEIISRASWSDRQQYLIRVELSGVERPEEERDRRFVGIARSFLGAATPAYEACRWRGQDEENRRWIAQLVPLLKLHEQAISRRLAELYDRPLAGLPIRVDVVETVNWSGATTIFLSPAGGHILISTEAAPGPLSLELVFHEASHLLMGPGHPVRDALRKAAERLEAELPPDLWHAVLFLTTGDAVRRILAAAGQPDYTPLLYANNIFGRFHEPMQRSWTPYLESRSTLEEAAADLIRALGDGESGRP